MSTTNFTSGTVIASDWLNDVDDIVYRKSAEWVSVKDFGAVGDGTTDDTAAIQAAIDSMTSGGVVYFPPGDYYTSAIITVAVEATSLVGAGTVSTRIKANHTAGAVFRFTRSYCGIKSMMVWGTATRVASTDATGFGVHFECDDAVDSSTNRTRYILVEHCRIVQQPSSGVAIVGPVTNGSVIRQCYIQSNRGHGIVIDRGDLTSRSNMGGAGPVAVSIADCEIHGNGGNAIAAGSPTDTATTPTARITLDNLDIASNATNVSTRYGTHQVWLRGTNISVRDCGIASDGTAAGILIAGRNHFITNNRFIECTASVEIEDFTALSGLSTQGVTIEGLSVITAVALAQNPAVILNSGVTATSIKNWLPSNITSIVTAGYQVELQQTPQMVVKTTDTVINNTDVLADDPDLKFWVAANESVKFRVSLQHISANTGSDLKVAITCPSGSIRYGVPGGIKIDTAETVAVQNDISASGSAITFGSTTSRRNTVIEGYCANGSTAGYLTVQWAQASATAANTTVYTYSNMTIWRKV